jgi:ATP-dependent Clp protease ATP-binding subunit ClpA
VGRVQDRQAPLDVFVGRTAEIARVAEVATRVLAGQPWLVAIEGDSGVGKRRWPGDAWPRTPG